MRKAETIFNIQWSRLLRVAAAICLVLVLATGCSLVHEFPDTPDTAALSIHLRFDTDMPQMECVVPSRSVAHVPTTSRLSDGTMRYIIRLYAKSPTRQNDYASDYREFTFTRDIANGYDADFTVEVPRGDYRIMAWADLTDSSGRHFYDASSFNAISLTKPHTGCTDYRDAFRGEVMAAITTSIEDQPAVEANISMQRPLAKYEFVANDLRLFTSQHADISHYRLQFVYKGYMPCTYSMFTDKPTDSATGVSFDGHFKPLSTDEASLGFDYIMVNGTDTEVTVQIALYDDKDNMLSLTQPVSVPLRRGRHTIVRGKFLTQQTTGGVGVDPSFDGDYNIRY